MTNHGDASMSLCRKSLMEGAQETVEWVLCRGEILEAQAAGGSTNVLLAGDEQRSLILEALGAFRNPWSS